MTMKHDNKNRLQTNPWHREGETKNTGSRNITIVKQLHQRDDCLTIKGHVKAHHKTRTHYESPTHSASNNKLKQYCMHFMKQMNDVSTITNDFLIKELENKLLCLCKQNYINFHPIRSIHLHDIQRKDQQDWKTS